MEKTMKQVATLLALFFLAFITPAKAQVTGYPAPLIDFTSAKCTSAFGGHDHPGLIWNCPSQTIFSDWWYKVSWAKNNCKLSIENAYSGNTLKSYICEVFNLDDKHVGGYEGAAWLWSAVRDPSTGGVLMWSHGIWGAYGYTKNGSIVVGSGGLVCPFPGGCGPLCVQGPGGAPDC